MSAMDFPPINGFGHLDFTVTDMDRSVRWWEEVMGFELVATRETPDYKLSNVLHPSLGAIGFMQHTNPASDRFDERAVGLDHFALRVPDRDALEAWAKHFDNLGVPHSGIQPESGGPLIVFRDPDNIQLELWAFDPALAVRNVDPAQD